MKNFVTKIFFGIFALAVLVFLFVMIYKTLVTAEITEKSKYEDVVVNKVNEVKSSAESEVKNTITKITKSEETGLDESAAVAVKVLCEKSYSNINSVYDELSSYSGNFIGTDGNIYSFRIVGDSSFGTMSLDERNQIMILNSKKIGSIKKDDLVTIKKLVKKVKANYEEIENKKSESEYVSTKMIAVYDYTRGERISISEDGNYTVTNTTDEAKTLLYYIGQYITSYYGDNK